MTSVASGATTDEFPVCCSFIASQLKTLSFTALSNLCFLQIYYLLSISVVLYPSCTVYSWLIKPASPGWGPESCVVWKRLWFCGVPQAWGPLLCLHCGLPFGPPPFSLLSFQPSLPSAPLPSAFSPIGPRSLQPFPTSTLPWRMLLPQGTIFLMGIRAFPDHGCQVDFAPLSLQYLVF